MKTKFNLEVIASFGAGTNSLGYAECYLCRDGDYINVYIVDEVFQSNKLNSLQEQIPLENFKEVFKSDAFMHSRIIEKDLWNMYGHFSDNELPYSFGITCYDDGAALF